MINRRQMLVTAGALAGLSATNATAADSHAFAITSIVLYLPEQAVEARGPSKEGFEKFIGALVARANALMSGAPRPGMPAALVVGLKPPARSRVWLVANDKPREAELTTLLKAPLEAILAPPVTGFNAFALNFNAWGGNGPNSMGYPIPDEWKHALVHGGMLPDDAFKIIWPD